MVATPKKMYYAVVGPMPGVAIGQTIMVYEEKDVTVKQVIYVGVGVQQGALIPPSMLEQQQQAQPLYALLVGKELSSTTTYEDFIKEVS